MQFYVQRAPYVYIFSIGIPSTYFDTNIIYWLLFEIICIRFIPRFLLLLVSRIFFSRFDFLLQIILKRSNKRSQFFWCEILQIVFGCNRFGAIEKGNGHLCGSSNWIALCKPFNQLLIITQISHKEPQHDSKCMVSSLLSLFFLYPFIVIWILYRNRYADTKTVCPYTF